MNFNEWVKRETGMTWLALQMEGTTEEQRYRLYDDYEQYCRENNIEPNYNFTGGN